MGAAVAGERWVGRGGEWDVVCVSVSVLCEWRGGECVDEVCAEAVFFDGVTRVVGPCVGGVFRECVGNVFRRRV